VLVIIDPVSAYLGVDKVDRRSATDVRGVLTPMKDMAEELHVAVIGIAHFNKKDDIKSALLRVSDGIAYVAAARHVHAVLDDPECKESKLLSAIEARWGFTHYAPTALHGILNISKLSVPRTGSTRAWLAPMPILLMPSNVRYCAHDFIEPINIVICIGQGVRNFSQYTDLRQSELK
jgi:hypothetical protein